jgi:DNA-binding transcriptional LysR family regulator
MKYTLNQLKIFHTVVQEKSISRAAEKLNLTQPAVSIQIKKLQDQFEIPLIEIIGRRVHITEFGKSIAEVCDTLLQNTDLISQTVSQYKGILMGNIRLSIVSTAKYVMPYFLSGFMRKYPNVQLHINVTNKATVVNTLVDNECDFALVSVLPDSLNLNSLSLLPNNLKLVCSAKNENVIKHIGDLKNETLIFREKGSATRNAMEEYLLKHNVQGYKKITLVSNEAVKQAVMAGLGYSIMPLIGLGNEITLNKIQVIEMPGLPITTKWNMVSDMQKKLSPAANALLAYIKENKDDVIRNNFKL